MYKREKQMKKLLLTMLACAIILPAVAQSDTETGLWTSAEVQKKLSKQWNIAAEAEYRLREDFGATDRWTIAASATYNR